MGNVGRGARGRGGTLKMRGAAEMPPPNPFYLGFSKAQAAPSASASPPRIFGLDLVFSVPGWGHLPSSRARLECGKLPIFLFGGKNTKTGLGSHSGP